MTEPWDVDSQYTETVVWIDGQKQCVYPLPPASGWERKKTRKKLWVTDDTVVMVSGAMAHKIQDRLLVCWAEILEHAPDAILVLYPFAPNWSIDFSEQGFADRLRAHGFPEDRVIILPTLPPEIVSKVLEAADLYLDSFPYTGATTVCEALSRGLPVVTLAGGALRELTGASWLRAYGLDGLVAGNPAEYVGNAVRLATDPVYMAEIAAHCAAQASQPAPPHNDQKGFAAVFGAALRQIAEARLPGTDNGVQKAAFAVPVNSSSPTARRFVVHASPRSGSTLFCSILNQAPGVVCHYELFHNEYIQYHDVPSQSPKEIFQRDSNPVNFLEKTFRQSAKDAVQVIGFKLLAHHPAEIIDMVSEDPAYRHVMLTRQNRLAQYSSLTIANATERWVKREPGALSADRIDWDQGAFEEFRDNQDRNDQEQLSRLKAQGKDVLLIDYSQLRLAETWARLSDYLDVSISVDAAWSDPIYRQNSPRVLDRFNDPDVVLAYLQERDLVTWSEPEQAPQPSPAP